MRVVGKMHGIAPSKQNAMSEILKLLIKCLLNAWTAEKSVSENSILGESRFDRESRRFWGIFILICLILALLAGTGVIPWRW